jgi:hypothetical protein
MRKVKWFLVVAAVFIVIGAVGARYGIQIMKDGALAYMYGYPLVLMDATRKVDPLVVASGAQVIDSTSMSLDEVIQTVVSVVKGES